MNGKAHTTAENSAKLADWFRHQRDHRERVRKTTASAIEKLNPRNFPLMPRKIAAIVGYILDQEFTTPRIVDMAVTSTGHVLAQFEGHTALDDFIANEFELELFWGTLILAAGITPEEYQQVMRLFTHRIRRV